MFFIVIAFAIRVYLNFVLIDEKHRYYQQMSVILNSIAGL